MIELWRGFPFTSKGIAFGFDKHLEGIPFEHLKEIDRIVKGNPFENLKGIDWIVKGIPFDI